MAGVQVEQVSKQQCCAAVKTLCPPEISIHEADFSSLRQASILGSFFPCSGAHTGLLQGLAPGFEMVKTLVFYFCHRSILWEKMLSQLIRVVSLEFLGL